jgi:transcriptional regulator with XRE-family HTH domain
MSKILEIWLKEKGWTQSRLADELNISRSAVSQIMLGKSNPSLDTASKLIKLSEKYDHSSRRLTLEMLIQSQQNQPDTQQEENEIETEEITQNKGRLSVVVDSALIERLRNAAFWTPGMSLARLVAQALGEYARRLEASAADLPDPESGKIIHKAPGDPFPTRTAPLVTGKR